METRVNDKGTKKQNKKKGDEKEKRSSPSIFSILIQVSFTSITCTVILQISPYYLEPIFGNVLPYLHFQSSCFLSFLIGFLLGLSISTSSFVTFNNVVDFISLVLALVPLSVNFLFVFSSSFGPFIGPHLTQLAFSYPIFFVLGSLNATLCKTRTQPTQSNQQILHVILNLSSNYILTTILNQNFVSNKSCQFIISLSVGFTLVSFAIKILGFLFSKLHFKVGKLLPQVLVLLLYIYNSNYNIRCQDKLTPSHNANHLDYIILARTHSVTGWLSVIEDTKRNFLAMRSGHSLIGGKYKNSNESIFTSFYLMEIAFLVSQTQINEKQKALQIGVGCGITTNEIANRNIDFDAVEIDPVVYFFARGYFNLTGRGNIYFKDGRVFMDNAKDSEYDYIFHDVFTGGSVPAKLFSYEAVKEMRRILKPNGVLAMNFVGSSHPNHRTSLDFVATTLSSHFKHVLCFSDNSNQHTSSSSKKQPIFGNFLFLASPEPIEFRKPTENDYSNSYSRKFIFKHFTEWGVELNTHVVDGVIYERDISRLERESLNTAVEHWNFMREGFDDEFWLNY